jgi:hypothetical protein
VSPRIPISQCPRDGVARRAAAEQTEQRHAIQRGRAFNTFLDEKTFTATQIEFVNLIVNHLTEQGVMSANLLYESPFTDLAPTGAGRLVQRPAS